MLAAQPRRAGRGHQRRRPARRHARGRADLRPALRGDAVRQPVRARRASRASHLRKLVSTNLQRGGAILSWGGLTAKARCKAGELDLQIKVGGKPLVETATYKLVTSDFLASGGDGLIGRLKLPEGSVKMTDVIIRDAIADVLRKKQGARSIRRQLFSADVKRMDYEGSRPRRVRREAADHRPGPTRSCPNDVVTDELDRTSRPRSRSAIAIRTRSRASSRRWAGCRRSSRRGRSSSCAASSRDAAARRGVRAPGRRLRRELRRLPLRADRRRSSRSCSR